MAKIFISHTRQDRAFVEALTEGLEEAGHEVANNYQIEGGQPFNKVLSERLKNSDIVVAIISQNSTASHFVLTEIGAAKVYSEHDGRLLLVPVVLDNVPIPSSVSDIACILSPERDVVNVLSRINFAIGTFVAQRSERALKAKREEHELKERAQQLENDASSYIEEAIKSLKGLESRHSQLASRWQISGALALICGVSFAAWTLFGFELQKEISWATLTYLSIKSLIVVALLGACARYAFVLGRSYANESLKSTDRIHAIMFGKFYIKAFGATTNWSEIKEAFQHWNIDRASSFASIDVASFDPRLVEQLVEVVRIVNEKRDGSNRGPKREGSDSN